MKNADSSCAIPVYTPGYSMRVGERPILPYMTPGSVELCDHVFPLIAERNSVLLANHGPLAVDVYKRQAFCRLRFVLQLATINSEFT